MQTSPVSLVALLICAVFGVALASDHATQMLALDGVGVVQGEWWRLWSAHLSHYSMAHAAVNALVLFVAGGIVEIRLGSRWLAIRLLLVAPILSLVLLLCSPDLLQYRGLSAVCVCLTVVAMISVARDSQQSLVAMVVLAAALVLKLASDVGDFGFSQAAGLDFASLPLGVVVDWRAHLLGALAGIAVATQTTAVPRRARHHQAASHGGSASG